MDGGEVCAEVAKWSAIISSKPIFKIQEDIRTTKLK
jgi:hypothetical protein